MRLIRPAQALLLSLALVAAGCAATTPTPVSEAPSPPAVGANAPLEHAKAPVVRTPMTEKPLGTANSKAAQKGEPQPKKVAVTPQPAERPAPAARAPKGKPAPAPAQGKAKTAKTAEKAKAAGPGKPPKDLNLDKARLSQNSLYKVSYQPQPAQTQTKRPQEWKIKVLNKAGKPVTGAKVRLSGASPQNGHKLSPSSLEATNLGHGFYRAKGLVFAQPGWWVVTVEVNNQGRGDRAQFNLLLK